MKILGGRIVSVKAEKLEGATFAGIEHSIRISDVRESGKNIAVHYDNTMNYKNGFAKLSIEGVIEAEVDAKEKKKILDEWDKKKQLPLDVAEEFLPAINYASGAIGTLLAFAINVNAPLNVPRSKIMPVQGEKAG